MGDDDLVTGLLLFAVYASNGPSLELLACGGSKHRTICKCDLLASRYNSRIACAASFAGIVCIQELLRFFPSNHKFITRCNRIITDICYYTETVRCCVCIYKIIIVNRFFGLLNIPLIPCFAVPILNFGLGGNEGGLPVCSMCLPRIHRCANRSGHKDIRIYVGCRCAFAEAVADSQGVVIVHGDAVAPAGNFLAVDIGGYRIGKDTAVHAVILLGRNGDFGGIHTTLFKAVDHAVLFI